MRRFITKLTLLIALCAGVLLLNHRYRSPSHPSHCSFAPGTGVLMDDGTAKAIDQIQVGDSVIAKKEGTNETAEAHAVLAISRNSAEEMVAVYVAKDGITNAIVATHDHAFWVKKKGWLSAGSLKPGAILMDANGNDVVVAGKSVIPEQTPTYNLNVSSASTFFVVSGNISVLVHK